MLPPCAPGYLHAATCCKHVTDMHFPQLIIFSTFRFYFTKNVVHLSLIHTISSRNRHSETITDDINGNNLIYCELPIKHFKLESSGNEKSLLQMQR